MEYITCELGAKEHATDLCLVVFVLFVAGLSFWTATRHMSHSVWFDESQTAAIAQQSTLKGVAIQAMKQRPYPPLFFSIMHESLRIWNGEAGLRLPAAFFGALAILAVFWLGKTLVDGVTGALAALLCALTPGMFRYMVDGNAYTLLVFLSILSTLYAFRAAESNCPVDWVMYCLFALLGLATHTLFVFHVAAQFCGVVYLRATAAPAQRCSYTRLLTVFSVVGTTWLLWVAAYHTHHGVALKADPTSLQAATLITIAGMFAGPLCFGTLAQLVPFAVLGAMGAMALFLRSRRVFWFTAIISAVSLVFITLFVRVTLHFVGYRYGLGVFPLACLVLACAPKLGGNVESGNGWLRTKIVKKAAYAVLTAYGIFGIAFFATANSVTFENQNWRDAARYIAAHAKNTDGIVLARSWDTEPFQPDTEPFQYYYRGGAETLTPAHKKDLPDMIARMIGNATCTG